MITAIIIDDDELMLEKLSTVFPWAENNFIVQETFFDSNDALKYLEKNPVDVIFTDIRMPSPDGLEISRICSEEYPHIKIVILSAYKDFEYAQRCIKYNVFRYLTKPIDYTEFINTLSSLNDEIDDKDIEFQPKADSEEGFIENEDGYKTNQKLMKYVNENFSKNISRDDVAAHISMNPSYFSVYFKQLTGQNFVSYITCLRMEKAQELLVNTNTKIEAIAFEVGFNNVSHFFSVFVKHFGETPAQYRKKHKK